MDTQVNQIVLPADTALSYLARELASVSYPASQPDNFIFIYLYQSQEPHV
jgi:hypothetical protein